MHQVGPSRRAVLVGAGLLAIAACSPSTDPEPPKPDPDLPIRALAADGVRRLVALYDAVGLAHPGLRAQLAPLAAETAAHLSALAPTGSSTTSPPVSPSASATPTVAVPPTAAAARAALARAERHEADLRVTALASASAALARLLAAIGASEATHAALLRASS